jgi:hypothetical protein
VRVRGDFGERFGFAGSGVSDMLPSVDGRRRSTRRRKLFVRVEYDVKAVLEASYVSGPCCRGREGVEE